MQSRCDDESSAALMLYVPHRSLISEPCITCAEVTGLPLHAPGDPRRAYCPSRGSHSHREQLQEDRNAEDTPNLSFGKHHKLSRGARKRVSQIITEHCAAQLGSRLGIPRKSRAVKQWKKLIQLGMDYVFHAATISKEAESEKLAMDRLSKTLERLGNVKPEVAMFVACHLENEIASTNAARMITARIMTGAHRTSIPRAFDEKPTFEISKLSGTLEIPRGGA
jgi:hypothetical protein